MALSNSKREVEEEASNNNNLGTAGEPNRNTNSPSISFSPVNLKNVPHLTDYLQLENLKTYTNPLDQNRFFHPSHGFYVSPSDVILRQIVYDLSSACGAFSDSDPRVHVAYHRAGPRKQIFFEPKNTRAAIVTCGGLCPGLNTVIRELVVGLWELYGVRQIFGIQAGYRGFYSTTRNPLVLNPKMVRGWHKLGGTMLETSRGGFDLHQIVDAIQTNAFNQVTVFLSLNISSLIFPWMFNCPF